jgi:small-conductance mechanosensitive channel
VQATGFASSAITLSISYWYPSTMTSDSSVTDGVIRAVKTALTKAGIELAVPMLDVEREAAATKPAGKAAVPDAATDDSAATSDGTGS